ncbi:MAG: hypothetical protein QNJ14_11810 [Woeseiaceae bacterium]|nr:hypothetical protein [Woeseiaceae bacterium]
MTPTDPHLPFKTPSTVKGHSILTVAILVLGCAACVSQVIVPLSDPSHWNGDFMVGALPTADCGTDTITNVRGRMTVAGPFTVQEYEQMESFVRKDPVVYKRVSDFTRNNIEDGDAIYDVQHFVLGKSNSWGYFGYVVARGDCVIHVGKMGYIN